MPVICSVPSIVKKSSIIYLQKLIKQYDILCGDVVKEEGINQRTRNDVNSLEDIARLGGIRSIFTSKGIDMEKDGVNEALETMSARVTIS